MVKAEEQELDEETDNKKEEAINEVDKSVRSMCREYQATAPLPLLINPPSSPTTNSSPSTTTRLQLFFASSFLPLNF